ncbi:BrnA antitoxin family protein [Massilia sp. TS11]|uniref:BrnA antitoxin family protein n=1 Tax=Massilia sp. TS11 TaxID=2908003 RepID=UPI001EDB348B|nr:BrnA antitoxin family protein [Massilia sp. TS11]MCG2585200.1 BrnA antitoxin family protein [Massilia sp. TS11]
MNLQPAQTEILSQAATRSSTLRQRKRKTRITIYLDDEVIERFRGLAAQCGQGYQTLINAALRGKLSPAGVAELAAE